MTAECDVPELILERYLLDELPPERRAALEERLRTDAALRARLERLRQDNRTVLQRYPVAWTAARICRRLTPAAAAPASRRLRLWLVPAVALATLVLVVPAVWRRAPDPDTRIKGSGPRLQLFRQTDSGSEPLADSSSVQSGDRVQIVYHAAGQPYGAIVSLDGRGVQTWHLPTTGTDAVPLRHYGPDTLAHSYQLDDAPRWERFYLITAREPFPLAVVGRSLTASAAPRGAPPDLSLPGDLQQQVFTLLKAPGP